MIIRSFLSWVQHAPIGSRAQAVRALARAFLQSEMSDEDRREAEAALTYLLEDPAVEVRLAMAEVFAHGANVPRHLLSSLICDEDQVALPLLSYSPDISEGELIDLVATAEMPRVVAIARREGVSVALSAAICEVGDLEVCAAVLQNPSASFTDTSFNRLIERFGDHRIIQEELMARDDVSLSIRHTLLRRYTESLQEHPLVSSGFNGRAPEHLVAEAQDRATIALAWSARGEELERLVAHITARGEMTSMLLLRAAICGCEELLQISLSRIARMPERRIARLLENPCSSSTKALLGKVGMPARVHDLFQYSLVLWSEAAQLDLDHWEKTRLIVEELLEHQEQLGISALGDLQDLLFRLSNEAAREAAKARVAGILSQAA